MSILKSAFSNVIFAVVFLATGCGSIPLLSEGRPLEGEDVSTHSLADGQVEFRVKASTMTSTLWITAQLVNKSTKTLAYSTHELLQFEDVTCLEDQRFESRPSGVLAPNDRQIIRYTFRLYAAQKYSAEYERCKGQPLRFKIDGLKLGNDPVAPQTFTIEN